MHGELYAKPSDQGARRAIAQDEERIKSFDDQLVENGLPRPPPSNTQQNGKDEGIVAQLKHSNNLLTELVAKPGFAICRMSTHLDLEVASMVV